MCFIYVVMLSYGFEADCIFFYESLLLVINLLISHFSYSIMTVHNG